MNVKVKNYRGIKSAELDLAKINIVAARNGDSGAGEGGKTCLAQAVASVFTADPVPLPVKLTKAQQSVLVRSGTTGGQAVLTVDAETKARVKWPESKYDAKGSPPIISEISAGLSGFMEKPRSWRINTLMDLTGTKPTRKDLSSALSEAGIKLSDDGIARLWETIELNGWDEAAKAVQQKGTKLKGMWEQVTGEKKYGSQKAVSWRPDAWTDDLEKVSVDDLEKKLTAEKEYLEGAIKAEALSEDDRPHAEKLPENKKKLEEVKKKLDQLLTARRETEKARAKLPEPGTDRTVSCPHCKKPVVILGRELKMPKKLSDTEIKKRAEAIRDADKSLVEIDKKISDERGEIYLLENLIASGERYAKAEKSKVNEDLDDVRARVKRAEEQKAAAVAYREASKIAERINQNRTIQDILGPDGIRKTAAGKCIAKVNNILAGYCSIAGYSPVTITDSFDIEHDGNRFELLAENEQYRAEKIMQLTIASLAGDCVVVIDRFDILLRGLRNGMLKAIIKSGITAIIMISLDSPDLLPPLKKIDARRYWIQGGIVEEVVS